MSLRDFAIFIFFTTLDPFISIFYGYNSLQNPSENLARQLYPQVCEYVKLYCVMPDVCLRFKYGVEQRCVVLVHMYFVLSDKT